MNLIDLIYKAKRKIVSESGAHVMLTVIIVLSLIMFGVNPWIAAGAGVFINVLSEFILRKPDIYDVFYGTLGSIIGLAIYYLSIFAKWII